MAARRNIFQIAVRKVPVARRSLESSILFWKNHDEKNNCLVRRDRLLSGCSRLCPLSGEQSGRVAQKLAQRTGGVTKAIAYARRAGRPPAALLHPVHGT